MSEGGTTASRGGGAQKSLKGFGGEKGISTNTRKRGRGRAWSRYHLCRPEEIDRKSTIYLIGKRGEGNHP